MTELDFANVKVLVVGDVMLDRYWWGSVDRISPEAPVPVVRLDRTSNAAGGAANVAANIAGLGASAILVGITGNDLEAETLRTLIAENERIDCRLIGLDDRDTTVKTRIVAHNQHVVRLDQENTAPIAEMDWRRAAELICRLVDEVDAVVFSDYAKGFLVQELLVEVIESARANGKMVFVDPKSKDFSKYAGSTVITPNLKEAGEAVKAVLNSTEQLSAAGSELLDLCNSDAILITEGEHGMTLFDRSDKPLHLDALAQDVFDVTGAGDTVIAAFSVASASGMSFRNAANIANIAAGIAVGHIGTTVVTRGNLEEYLRSESKIVSNE